MGLKLEKIKQFHLGGGSGGSGHFVLQKYPKTALKDKIDILIMLHLIFFLQKCWYSFVS